MCGCSWEFQFCMFVKGKEMWGHNDGTSVKPGNPIKRDVGGGGVG